jgi:hypothetical protein
LRKDRTWLSTDVSESAHPPVSAMALSETMGHEEAKVITVLAAGPVYPAGAIASCLAGRGASGVFPAGPDG